MPAKFQRSLGIKDKQQLLRGTVPHDNAFLDVPTRGVEEMY